VNVPLDAVQVTPRPVDRSARSQRISTIEKQYAATQGKMVTPRLMGYLRCDSGHWPYDLGQ